MSDRRTTILDALIDALIERAISLKDALIARATRKRLAYRTKTVAYRTKTLNRRTRS